MTRAETLQARLANWRPSGEGRFMKIQANLRGFARDRDLDDNRGAALSYCVGRPKVLVAAGDDPNDARPIADRERFAREESSWPRSDALMSTLHFQRFDGKASNRMPSYLVTRRAAIAPAKCLLSCEQSEYDSVVLATRASPSRAERGSMSRGDARGVHAFG